MRELHFIEICGIGILKYGTEVFYKYNLIANIADSECFDVVVTTKDIDFEKYHFILRLVIQEQEEEGFFTCFSSPLIALNPSINYLIFKKMHLKSIPRCKTTKEYY